MVKQDYMRCVTRINAFEYYTIKCIVMLQGMLRLIILSLSTLQVVSGVGTWSCPNHTETDATLLEQFKSRMVHEIYVHRDIGLVCLQSDVFTSLGQLDVSSNSR